MAYESGTTSQKAFFSSAAADKFKLLPPSLRRTLASEMEGLDTPSFGNAASVEIPGASGYRLVRLPSGYAVVYRFLGPDELTRLPSHPRSGILIADIEPSPETAGMPSSADQINLEIHNDNEITGETSRKISGDDGF
jgi:hypothetical protein